MALEMSGKGNSRFPPAGGGGASISLILPTYNEGENIQTLIRRIYSVFALAEVIVVDDDSPDRTWESAEVLCREYPRLRVHRRVGERGLRTALQAGIGMAGGECVGWLDCDLSMPPELLCTMAEMLESADLVLGSRYVPGGRDARPMLRRITSLLINRTAKALLRTRTLDLTSGFILCRKPLLEEIPLIGNYGEYCIALLYGAERAGFKVEEVPYRFTDRSRGQSKTSPSLGGFALLGFRYLGMIFRLLRQRPSC